MGGNRFGRLPASVGVGNFRRKPLVTLNSSPSICSTPLYSIDPIFGWFAQSRSGRRCILHMGFLTNKIARKCPKSEIWASACVGHIRKARLTVTFLSSVLLPELVEHWNSQNDPFWPRIQFSRSYWCHWTFIGHRVSEDRVCKEGLWGLLSIV